MTEPVDLSRDACERRLGLALLEITEHPEHWDQTVWALAVGNPQVLNLALSRREFPCGTAACLAGTMVVQAGLAEAGPAIPTSSMTWGLQVTAAGQELLREHPVYRHDWTEPSQDFAGLGHLLLGLSGEEVRRLFWSDRTLAELWELATQFTVGRVVLPPELVDTVRRVDTERRNREAEGA